MRYYQLAVSGEDRWHLEVDGESAPLDIWECCYVLPRPMHFVKRVLGTEIDFTHTGWASIPIVSRRLAECLGSVAPNDVQRIPAIIKGEPSGEWEVLNVLARPDCIAYNKSNITFYPHDHPEKAGKPRGVLKLIVDPERAGRHSIFRPRDWEIALVVSELAKNTMEAVGITGIEFWSVTANWDA